MPKFKLKYQYVTYGYAYVEAESSEEACEKACAENVFDGDSEYTSDVQIVDVEDV